MSAVPQPAADKDSRSVAEARELVERAYNAFLEYQHFTQEQVDRIIDAMASAATAAAEKIAKLAVEETGYGVVADKVQKNLFSSERVYQALRGMKTVGMVREDREQGIIEVAAPVGVVAAVLPSTNPTSTAIYKILIALKGRNAIVLSPHPTAFRCTCEITSIMRDAAIKAGAPSDVICCFSTPTLAGTQELMKHRRTSVILATGGMGIVRAAYSSGKPAFGVGPGNVPVFIDQSADVKKAVADVVFGKTFDNGTICSSEQAIVAEEAIHDHVTEELRRNGAYFLTEDEVQRLGRDMVNLEQHTINPKFVGKSAQRVAELAGFKVPDGTRLLVAPLKGVGREHPLSAEKLSPVLALYFTRDRSAGFDTCLALLRFGGLGHTCVIHGRDDAVIREYGLKMPAGRIVVNSPSPHGSIGASTNLFPAMTLGCGAVGGNITSDNISPMHLINLRRLAYEARPVTQKEVVPVAGIAAPAAGSTACACQAGQKDEGLPLAASGAPDRVAVAQAIERFLAKKTGKPAPVPAPAPPASTPNQAATPPVSRPKPRPVDFVSEQEIRAALKRKEKILIGSKTIITPAARDLAAQHDVFTIAE
ncbi:MAG TPA: aldehyde dehydrogenase family protein [Terriglobales bacterium]|nr:aldehyde dehydrogenase family protein [Terriglobales bacterium]